MKQMLSLPAVARTAAVIIATACMALLAVACSSSPSSTDPGAAANAGGATGSASAVAYSQCMRAHGVPRYPDPGSDGGVPKGSAQTFGVSDSVFQAAQNNCQHLLPTGGSLEQQARQCINAGDCPPALVQQILTAQRKFARCMRSHGVPNWPDPTIGRNGAPIFNLIPAGISHDQAHNPPVSTKIAECERLDPAPAAMESS
jgi:hypothetical protein